MRLACNLHCPCCFSKTSVSALRTDQVDWKRLDVSRYYEFARERGASRLVITGGGEPLLRSEDVVYLVGLGRATQLLMLGDTIDAEHAERIGLISALVGADELEAAVARLARRLADGPAQAYAQTKALLTREQDMSLSAALELEAVTQALLMTGQDYAEFHAAFTAGREPHWRGR